MVIFADAFRNLSEREILNNTSSLATHYEDPEIESLKAYSGQLRELMPWMEDAALEALDLKQQQSMNKILSIVSILELNDIRHSHISGLYHVLQTIEALPGWITPGALELQKQATHILRKWAPVCDEIDEYGSWEAEGSNTVFYVSNDK